jgi:hypothetical protein
MLFACVEELDETKRIVMPFVVVRLKKSSSCFLVIRFVNELLLRQQLINKV